MMGMHTITIVGVGLLGGSIGLAARRRGLARHIIGVGHQQRSLDVARERGAIDVGTMDLQAAVKDAGLVIVCTPVDLIVQQVQTAAACCPAGAIFTDVGSTKAAIVRGLDGQLPPGKFFVGSHPLAGSEKRGVEFADANLFDDRVTVVTPVQATDRGSAAAVAGFWEALGSRVCWMTPEEHDRALALTSHLPHLVASALAGLLPENLFDLAATGFRDTTRIAAGDPSVWTGIFQQNRDAVIEALGWLTGRMRDFERALQADDRAAIDSFLAQAKRVRDALGSGNSTED
jgi:prephenate dehydrogenase